MSKETIREHINALPFVPFRIYMADGSWCDVPARDFVSISPKGRTVTVWEGNHLRILDALLVTQINVEEAI